MYFNEKVVEQRKSQSSSKGKVPGGSEQSKGTRDVWEVWAYCERCTGLELCLVAYPIIGDSASSSRKLVKESHGGVLWGFQPSPEGFSSGGVCQIMLITATAVNFVLFCSVCKPWERKNVLQKRWRNITRIPCGVLTSLGLLTASPSILIPSPTAGEGRDLFCFLWVRAFCVVLIQPNKEGKHLVNHL